MDTPGHEIAIDRARQCTMTLQAGEHAGSDSSHSPLRWQKGRAPRMTAE